MELIIGDRMTGKTTRLLAEWERDQRRGIIVVPNASQREWMIQRGARHMYVVSAHQFNMVRGRSCPVFIDELLECLFVNPGLLADATIVALGHRMWATMNHKGGLTILGRQEMVVS